MNLRSNSPFSLLFYFLFGGGGGARGRLRREGRGEIMRGERVIWWFWGWVELDDGMKVILMDGRAIDMDSLKVK